MAKIKVLLADDHAVLRAGLRMLLDAQPDIEVGGEAENGEEAIEKVAELQPDIVLMDITMAGMGGLQATRELVKKNPEMKILILTMHDDEGYLRQCLQAGASGYVLKKAADTELTAAIRAVHRGDVYIYPSMAKVVVEGYLQKDARPPETSEEYDRLTGREHEVLQLIAKGHTNQQTADSLFVSVKTIETHRSHIMEKLKLRNRAELVRYAIEKGLL
ncbi:MAG: response regulator transcription factor [Gemmatimonadetes bacterium]|jgi:two-component system, NarL family, response regulator NreC|nr:response regulator transcription factor [Gemmatimonadota bacterium]